MPVTFFAYEGVGEGRRKQDFTSWEYDDLSLPPRGCPRELKMLQGCLSKVPSVLFPRQQRFCFVVSVTESQSTSCLFDENHSSIVMINTSSISCTTLNVFNSQSSGQPYEVATNIIPIF